MSKSLGVEQARTPNRKLVVVDLENVLFGVHEQLIGADLREQTAQILDLAQARRADDQLIVGCNPHLAFAARAAFPRAQLLTRKGADGADQALIDHLDVAHIAARYNELCIVSGDHAFADLAHEARWNGLTTRVVAPHLGLSAALRLQADVAVRLPKPAGGWSDATAA